LIEQTGLHPAATAPHTDAIPIRATYFCYIFFTCVMLTGEIR